MKLAEKFQTLMAAAAFAEENEHVTALELAGEALAGSAPSRETCAPLATLAVNPGK